MTTEKRVSIFPIGDIRDRALEGEKVERGFFLFATTLILALLITAAATNVVESPDKDIVLTVWEIRETYGSNTWTSTTERLAKSGCQSGASRFQFLEAIVCVSFVLTALLIFFLLMELVDKPVMTRIALISFVITSISVAVTWCICFFFMFAVICPEGAARGTLHYAPSSRGFGYGPSFISLSAALILFCLCYVLFILRRIMDKRKEKKEVGFIVERRKKRQEELDALGVDEEMDDIALAAEAEEAHFLARQAAEEAGASKRVSIADSTDGNPIEKLRKARLETYEDEEIDVANRRHNDEAFISSIVLEEDHEMEKMKRKSNSRNVPEAAAAAGEKKNRNRNNNYFSAYSSASASDKSLDSDEFAKKEKRAERRDRRRTAPGRGEDGAVAVEMDLAFGDPVVSSTYDSPLRSKSTSTSKNPTVVVGGGVSNNTNKKAAAARYAVDKKRAYSVSTEAEEEDETFIQNNAKNDRTEKLRSADRGGGDTFDDVEDAEEVGVGIKISEKLARAGTKNLIVTGGGGRRSSAAAAKYLADRNQNQQKGKDGRGGGGGAPRPSQANSDDFFPLAGTRRASDLSIQSNAYSSQSRRASSKKDTDNGGDSSGVDIVRRLSGARTDVATPTAYSDHMAQSFSKPPRPPSDVLESSVGVGAATGAVLSSGAWSPTSPSSGGNALSELRKGAMLGSPAPRPYGGGGSSAFSRLQAPSQTSRAASNYSDLDHRNSTPSLSQQPSSPAGVGSSRPDTRPVSRQPDRPMRLSDDLDEMDRGGGGTYAHASASNRNEGGRTRLPSNVVRGGGGAQGVGILNHNGSFSLSRGRSSSNSQESGAAISPRQLHSGSNNVAAGGDGLGSSLRRKRSQRSIMFLKDMNSGGVGVDDYVNNNNNNDVGLLEAISSPPSALTPRGGVGVGTHLGAKPPRPQAPSQSNNKTAAARGGTYKTDDGDDNVWREENLRTLESIDMSLLSPSPQRQARGGAVDTTSAGRALFAPRPGSGNPSHAVRGTGGRVGGAAEMVVASGTSAAAASPTSRPNSAAQQVSTRPPSANTHTIAGTGDGGGLGTGTSEDASSPPSAASSVEKNILSPSAVAAGLTVEKAPDERLRPSTTTQRGAAAAVSVFDLDDHRTEGREGEEANGDGIEVVEDRGAAVFLRPITPQVNTTDIGVAGWGWANTGPATTTAASTSAMGSSKAGRTETAAPMPRGTVRKDAFGEGGDGFESVFVAGADGDDFDFKDEDFEDFE